MNAKLNAMLENAGDSTRRRLGLKKARNLDAQVKQLRERVAAATAHETTLRQQVDSLYAEVDRLDQQADAAVRDGDDATARQLIGQMQRVQQRLTMAEADLDRHQLVAEELIQQVTALEVAITEAKATEAAAADKPTPVTPKPLTPEEVAAQARQKIDELGELIALKKDGLDTFTGEESAAEQAHSEANKSRIDDELEARRQRLSKK